MTYCIMEKIEIRRQNLNLQQHLKGKNIFLVKKNKIVMFSAKFLKTLKKKYFMQNQTIKGNFSIRCNKKVDLSFSVKFTGNQIQNLFLKFILEK